MARRSAAKARRPSAARRQRKLLRLLQKRLLLLRKLLQKKHLLRLLSKQQLVDFIQEKQVWLLPHLFCMVSMHYFHELFALFRKFLYLCSPNNHLTTIRV
jgi:hypothetical protein